jgi:DNA primase
MTLKDAGFETDPAGGTALVVDRLAPILDGIPDRRERGLRAHGLAEALHLRDDQLEDFLQEARRKIRPAFSANTPEANSAYEMEGDRPAPPPPDREFQLLRLMLMFPDCRAYYRGQDAARWITANQVRDALDELADAMEQELEIQPGVFVASLRDPTLRNLLAQSLVSDAPAVQDMTDARGLLKQLHIDHLSRRIKARKRELDSATQSGDDVAAMNAVTEMKRYAKEIEALKRDA